MTELEYEKACRGFAQPVAKEYAWGTADINLSGDVLNTGTDREVAQNKLANISAGSAGVLNGPTRVGSFARETTNRVLAGSSFFGILDLSGNLREVTVLVTENPKFTGLHGDGETKTNVQFWPASETHPTSPNLYVILRGDFDMGVSTRNYPVTILDINPSERDGGRGVRTAP